MEGTPRGEVERLEPRFVCEANLHQGEESCLPLAWPYRMPSVLFPSVHLGRRRALMSPSATYSSFHENKHPDSHGTPLWSVDWCLLCLSQIGPTQEPTQSWRTALPLGLATEGTQFLWRWCGASSHVGVHGDNFNWYLCSLAVGGMLLWWNKHANEIRAMATPGAWFPPRLDIHLPLEQCCPDCSPALTIIILCLSSRCPHSHRAGPFKCKQTHYFSCLSPLTSAWQSHVKHKWRCAHSILWNTG